MKTPAAMVALMAVAMATVIAAMLGAQNNRLVKENAKLKARPQAVWGITNQQVQFVPFIEDGTNELLWSRWSAPFQLSFRALDLDEHTVQYRTNLEDGAIDARIIEFHQIDTNKISELEKRVSSLEKEDEFAKIVGQCLSTNWSMIPMQVLTNDTPPTELFDDSLMTRKKRL